MPTTADHRDTTVLRPADVGELHAAITDTAGSHLRLLIAGHGTAADWGGRPVRPDAVLDITGLSGVLAYNPADMTIAVRAGTPLAAVRDELSARRQRVGFDAARVDRGATVGGLLATADAGPLRHRFGSLRDLVIGVTVVLADGTIAHSGGHVIKNVAGYDLAKLFHGSLGTLGVVAEVVLRLHPAPAVTSTVRIPAGAEAAADLAGRIMLAGLEPTALEWTNAGHLLVRLDGSVDGVRDCAAAVATVTGSAADILDETAADECWRAVAAIADGSPGDTVLRLGTLPSAGPHVLGRIADIAAAQRVSADVGSSVAVGVHTVRLRGGGSDEHDSGAHDAVLAELYDEVGSAITVQRRDGLSPAHPGWGPPPPSVAVLRAVKRRFDPDGRFGAGRFAHWLDDPGSPEDTRP